MDGASEKRGLQNAETPSEWREKAGKSRAREHERQRERDGLVQESLKIKYIYLQHSFTIDQKTTT